MPFDTDLLGTPIATPAEKPLRVSQVLLSGSKKAEETTLKKRHRLRRVAGKLVPQERVRGCGWKRHANTVDIVRSDHGAHVVGVETCGSVWHCPVCAAKIAERRREEVAAVIDGIHKIGGASYMLTLTMKHNRKDRLAYLREQIVNGWRSVQNRKAYRQIKQAFKVVGTIRAIEVTHGKNGWHPHLHILFVLDRTLEAAEHQLMKNVLSGLWCKVLEKQTNRYVSLDALDFRPATASDYLTKWGSDRELVKGHEKKGRHGGRTPWQLLEDYDAGDKQSGALFREYAETFKGTNQLTWSKGLRLYKRMMGIDDIDDAEAANASETVDHELPLEDAINLKNGTIGSLPGWVHDLIHKRRLTAHLIEAAHRGGWQGVIEMLEHHKIPVGDDLCVEGQFQPDKFADGNLNSWRQQPKGYKPAHPKYYLTWNHEEFMAHGPPNE